MPEFNLVCKSFAKQAWGSSYHKEPHIAFWFVISTTWAMQDREKICIYLLDGRDAAKKHLWVMNSVHFIQDSNPTEGQNIQCASTQLSSAQPCFALVIYPLLKPIWFPQRTLGWLPSICANLQTPREFWYPPDGASGKGEVPSMQRHRDILEAGPCIAEEHREPVYDLLYQVLSDRAKQQSMLHPEKVLRYLTPVWG